jgi:hypothetical protein
MKNTDLAESQGANANSCMWSIEFLRAHAFVEAALINSRIANFICKEEVQA